MGLETQHIFQKFSTLSRVDAPIVIAVSGGSDSVALLRLYTEFAAANLNISKPHCVTINHGLRKEAAEEAHFVASICRALGCSHKTLHWEGVKPQSHLQASAREARHHLLRQEALAVGAGAVLLGHSLDDQTETYVMRKKRSDSVRGLASIAPATLFGGDVWFTRPLLKASRQDLRNYLTSQNQSWVEDPSNQDMQFERVRVRSQMQFSHEEARQIAERQRCEDVTDAAAFVSTYFSVRDAGGRREAVFSVSPDMLRANASSLLALRMALALIGTRTYLPSEDAGQDALTRLSNLSKGAVTLSGCVVTSCDEGVLIKREVRGGDLLVQYEKAYDTALSLFDLYLPSFDLPLANVFAPFFGRNLYPASPIS